MHCIVSQLISKSTEDAGKNAWNSNSDQSPVPSNCFLPDFEGTFEDACLYIHTYIHTYNVYLLLPTYVCLCMSDPRFLSLIAGTSQWPYWAPRTY